MQESLHSQVQDLIRHRVSTSAATSRKLEHCEALLARVNMDASLLLSMYTTQGWVSSLSPWP